MERRRGGLFFIGLISAIATIVSLNVAFGRSGFYSDKHSFYNHYPHCYNKYDDRYRDDRSNRNEHKQQADSTNSNY